MTENSKQLHPIFYIANVIDYFRFVFLLIPVFTSKRYPLLTIILLTMSDVSDMFDGMCARKLNQTSYLGSCLDMAIDRVSYVVICMVILMQNPPESIAVCCVLCAIIDLLSHWLRFSMASHVHLHHKKMKSTHKLLNYYYEARWFLTTLCACNQTFMISFYGYLAATGLLK